MNSFSWATARTMLAAGFAPDSISSDVHALCIHRPAWDLGRTMTKFLARSQTLPQIITATTETPARAPRRPDLGTLKPASTGDVSILSLQDQPILQQDVLRETLTHPQSLNPQGRMIAGQWHD